MVMEGTHVDPAAAGIEFHVDLKDDGTISCEVYGRPTEGLWFVQGETVSFCIDGDTQSGTMEGELLVLRGGPSSMAFSRVPGGTSKQSTGHVMPEGLKTEVIYRMVSFVAVASGAEKSADVMPEYSLTFHADGTADFVMSGAPVPGIPWTTDEDGIALDYFGQTIRCTIDDGTVIMDFFGSMRMKMVPQE